MITRTEYAALGAGLMLGGLCALGAAWIVDAAVFETKNSPYDARVTLTEAGFEPRIVEVREGESVLFVSETGSHFWPASNIHPHHSIYPSFDPRRPLAPDEEWSFTFSRAGQWVFHDHLRAHHTGMVIVRGDEAVPLAEICASSSVGEAMQCWSILITEALREDGLDAAFDTVQHLHATYPAFAAACHNFTHDLGLLAFEKYGDDVPLSVKTGYCNDGFYHGYMEGFLTEHQDPQDARTFCDRVGRLFGSTYPSAINQCNHGIGHGTVEYLLHTRSDLWGDPLQVMNLAMDVCAQTQSDTTERFRCASGAYSVLGDWMLLQEEYAETYLPLDESAFWICEESKERWGKDGCVWEFAKRVARRMLGEQAASLSIIEAAGRKVADGAFTARAIRSVADGIGQGDVASAGAVDSVALCRVLSTDEMHHACIRGLVDGLFHAGLPGQEVDAAARFCLSGELSKDERRVCAEGLIERARTSFDPTQTLRACALLSNAVPEISALCTLQ